MCFQAKLPAQTEVVTTEDLMAHLGKITHELSANQLLRFIDAQMLLADVDHMSSDLKV